MRDLEAQVGIVTTNKKLRENLHEVNCWLHTELPRPNIYISCVISIIGAAEDVQLWEGAGFGGGECSREEAEPLAVDCNPDLEALCVILEYLILKPSSNKYFLRLSKTA